MKILITGGLGHIGSYLLENINKIKFIKEIYIIDNFSTNALDIKVFEADHTAYSKKLKRVVMMRDAKDHSMDDFVLLSGTKVREMLEEGKTLPAEFARAEVAEVLMAYYLDKTNSAKTIGASIHF